MEYSVGTQFRQQPTEGDEAYPAQNDRPIPEPSSDIYRQSVQLPQYQLRRIASYRSFSSYCKCLYVNPWMNLSVTFVTDKLQSLPAHVGLIHRLFWVGMHMEVHGHLMGTSMYIDNLVSNRTSEAIVHLTFSQNETTEEIVTENN